MARKIRTEQEKKRSRKRALIIILVLLVVISIGAALIIKVFKDDPKQVVKVNVLKQNDKYGYTLTDNDSDYFKDEFDKLIKIIDNDPVNEEEYATQVARMFTIDLFTMSTKINKYDIGGYEYYHSTKKDVFEKKVIYGLYETLLDNTYGDRNQELPEISNVETVSTEKTTYKLDTNEVDGYLVKLKMTYQKDLDYPEEASIVVCKEDNGRWSVVDFQPTLNPEYK